MARSTGDGVKLSRRQAQILEGIGRGNTYRVLAEKLAISPATVSYHVGQLQMRLRTPTLPALIGLAIVSGILSSDQFPLEWTGNLVVSDSLIPDGLLPDPTDAAGLDALGLDAAGLDVAPPEV